MIKNMSYTNKVSWYTEVIRERGGTPYHSKSKSHFLQHFDDAAEEAKSSISDVHQPHDKGYKSLLSSKAVFLSLLRSFVKRDWVALVNEYNLTRIDKSYISADFSGEESDLVYKVSGLAGQGLTGHEVYFYVLMELQSRVDHRIPFRLLSYMVELWREVMKNAGASARQRDFKLPVIVPIVLYNGKQPWKAPLRFREKLVDGGVLGEDGLDFSYVLIDVRNMDEEQLLRQGNLWSSVFIMDRTEANFGKIATALSQLLQHIRELSATEQELFWNWMVGIVGKRLPLLERQELDLLIRESKEKEAGEMISGLERSLILAEKKALREGEIVGELRIIRKLLSNGMSVKEVADKTGLPLEKVRELEGNL